MDMLRPTEAHGWREFLREVGIIIIGVLIALFAQQSAEALRWRQDVAQAREALDVQLAEHLFVESERIALAPCQDRVLARMSEIIRMKGPTPQITHPVQIPFRGWSISAWEAATASGVLAHMPSTLRREYADDVAFAKDAAAMSREEFTALADLRSLIDPTVLSDTTRDRLESDVARMRGLNAILRIGSQQMLASNDRKVRLRPNAAAELRAEQARVCVMPDDGGS